MPYCTLLDKKRLHLANAPFTAQCTLKFTNIKALRLSTFPEISKEFCNLSLQYMYTMSLFQVHKNTFALIFVQIKFILKFDL